MKAPIAPGATQAPRSNFQSEKAAPGFSQALANELTKPKEPDPVDPRVLEAARGMESLFIQQMLSEMRKTVPENDFDLENQATRFYRGLLDAEIAQSIPSIGKGVGLAEQFIAYLKGNGYNQRGANHTGAGGTDETHQSHGNGPNAVDD